jgi:hypothetical protein
MGLAMPAFAAPAPDIIGKSVVVNWSENRDVRINGTPRSGSVSFQLSIYLSSAGRPFARVTSASRAGTASSEQVGGSGASIGGGVRAVRADGHSVSVQSNFGNYARSTRIEVGSGGGSCSVQISLGKEVGSAPKAFQYGGQSIEVLSASVASSSCSMQEGNVFAH